MKRRAIIVGAGGQDGRILFDLLNGIGYEVVGLDTTSVRSNFGFDVSRLNILDSKDVSEFIASLKPQEIYYLAAFHHSSQDVGPGNTTLFSASMDVNVRGLVNFLEAVRQYSPLTRLFYAASSHIFKGSGTDCQNENTPVNPLCVYGITKAAGFFTCRYYRNEFSLFASVGIMYNHESSLRSENFISRKIIASAVRIKMGLQEKLVVGDLNAAIDWGYAPDYVEAMRLALMLDHADDFIIATGKLHTVRDFVTAAFSYFDMDYRDYVSEDQSIISKKQYRLIGDSSKIKEMTGWSPKTSFDEMIRVMIDDELLLQKKGLIA